MAETTDSAFRDAVPRVELNNGVKMPVFGFGTFLLGPGPEVGPAVEAAVATGYPLIDSAACYENEQETGDALQRCYERFSDLDRSKIFVTTKLQSGDQGYDKALEAFDLQLKKLQLDYVDLYLIHWPGVGGMARDDPKVTEIRKESWMALEKIYREGRAKAIGVSNYTVYHLKDLETYATITPAVNQIEAHPYFPQHEVRNYCKEKGIYVQAFPSLGRGALFTDPTIMEVASEAGKMPSHVLLRWAIQVGMGVIPKSKTPSRIVENSQIFDFELTDDQVDRINSIQIVKRLCKDTSDIV